MTNKIRILYAENDPMGSKLTKMILERIDFIVEVAPDGAKAWEAYKKQKPDILLLDLKMPKKSGLEVTRLVRERDKGTHIIVYTSHGEAKNEVALIDAGADEFFSKDKDPEVLAIHLNRLRDRILNKQYVAYIYQLSPDTTFNCVNRILTIREDREQLPYVDGRLLKLLCAKKNDIADKPYLIEGIWGNADIGKESELKKYVSRVRAYLKKDPSLQIEYREGGYILFSTSE